MKRRGFWGLAAHARTRLSALVSTDKKVVAFQVTSHEFKPVFPVEENWSFETLSHLVEGMPESLAALVSTRRRNESCHILKIGNEMAGWGFSACPVDRTYPIDETGTDLTMSLPGSMCLTAFETHPDYRRRGVYRALLSHIVQDYFERGGPSAFICSVSTNAASRAAIRQLGFTEIETHHYRRRLWSAQKTIQPFRL